MQGRGWLRLDVRCSAREDRTSNREGLVWRRARARTKNMALMRVTLDKSKPSGWLKADANCRVAREVMRNGVRRGPGGERAVGAVVVRAACREGLGRRFGARART